MKLFMSLAEDGELSLSVRPIIAEPPRVSTTELRDQLTLDKRLACAQSIVRTE
jgi:hypothetical protein